MSSDRLVQVAIAVVLALVVVWFFFGTTATSPPRRPPGYGSRPNAGAAPNAIA